VHPGAIFPGVFGGISILIGFFALSVLPFNWAGVALIVLAFILFGLELFIPSHGILGIGGAVALVLGGLLLTSGNPPEFQISRWLVIGMAAAMATMVLFVLVNIMRIRSCPPYRRRDRGRQERCCPLGLGPDGVRVHRRRVLVGGVRGWHGAAR
jgi:membrane-bound serine protease (ClpP class)